MNYSIIGTAGHIDHGKSSIIRALNGFWGDESDEEKRRGITIDLSFSYLKTPQKTLAFIDVPGHEKLTSTMISGAFGFDGCMVVIDVNEGIMPQSKEHLRVLDLLHVKQCIVVLSKCDLSDKQSINACEISVREEIKKYENLNIISFLKVSIYDEESIKDLKSALLNLPQRKEDKKGIFRCYIDRIFSIKGAGVVVTGTINEGEINLGEKIWISDISKQSEIKNIQIHEKEEKSAFIYQRVALNLTKIDKNQLKKGMLLTKKGYLRGFKNIDISLKTTKPLPHNAKITFHLGSKKVNGKVLHVKDNFSVFISQENIYAVFDEKFIISYKGEVIGGGRVLNPINDPIKKLKKIPILKALDKKDFKSAFLLLCKAHKKGFGLISAYQRFGLSHEKALEFLRQNQEIFLDEIALIAYPKTTIKEVENLILNIYTKNPYALISEKSLKHKWISQNLALKALKNLQIEKKIEFVKGVWIKSGIDTKNLEQTIQNKILKIIKENTTSPPSPYNIYDSLDIDRKSGDNALKSLTKSKKVIRLEHNFFISSEVLTKVMDLCREIIKNDGYVDIKNLKEKLNLSRKYLIAYLEYLDKFDDITKDGTKRFGLA